MSSASASVRVSRLSKCSFLTFRLKQTINIGIELVPAHDLVPEPHPDPRLRRTVEVFYSWCSHMGNMEYVEGMWTCHYCEEDPNCPHRNDVLGQVWAEWARKDAQGVITERWRNVRTKIVFGHFQESNMWELMWKSESSDADANDPPLSTEGMETNGSPPKKVWVWPGIKPRKKVVFAEIHISEIARIRGEMESG